MIPYFRPPSLDLGFVQLEPFGLLTAVGLLFATYLIARAARLEGKDPSPIQDAVVWALVGGVVAGHLTHLFLYHPEELAKSRWQVLRVWDGLSSTGGMLGGALAAIAYFKWKGLKTRTYMDPVALGIVPGWGIARLGCFMVHDHPGKPTSFFLAVDFPANVLPGGPRHDLGLYEALILFSIAAVLYHLRHRGQLKGALFPLAVGIYGFCRFWLDFLRADDLAYVDARYFGLTPAQYIAIGFVVYGIGALGRWAQQRSEVQPPLAPAKGSTKGSAKRSAKGSATVR